MGSMVIIHFHPVELYPPIMNMLNTLGENCKNEIFVFTYEPSHSKKLYHHPNIHIVRFKSYQNQSRLKRILSYLSFTINTVSSLIKLNPKNIFYYETKSALPVYYYLKFVGFGNKNLFIHYHEYHEPNEFKTGMKLVYYSYKKEMNLIKHAKWISHTNEYRVSLFKNDLPFPKKIEVLPNFPPIQWSRNNHGKLSENTKKPIKVVYIGSIGLANLHIASFCKWIHHQAGEATFDIYSQNLNDETLAFFTSLKSDAIRLHENSIWYYAIPDILKDYDVGVVLYKDYSKNYRYNETNKLFEYLSCGLDVWFPKELLGIHKHITKNTFPQVKSLDFENLQQYNIDELRSREGLTKKPITYNCENEYRKFCDRLQKYLIDQ